VKLDRNVNTTGLGKYALINLRTNSVEWGRAGEPDEFFVIKLRDRHARAALLAYAESMSSADPEFADEVHNLADRASMLNPFCKEPD